MCSKNKLKLSQSMSKLKACACIRELHGSSAEISHQVRKENESKEVIDKLICAPITITDYEDIVTKSF